MAHVSRPAPDRRFCLSAGGLFTLGYFAPARGQPAPSDLPALSPDTPVLTLRSGLLSLATAGWPPPASALKPLIAEAFGLTIITAAVLGATAASTTPEQADRFAQAFGQRMARALTRTRPDPEIDRFAIQEIRTIGPKEWLVISRGERPGEPDIVLAWRVRGLPEGPRIVDLMRDGVSAVQVQHDDIATALRTRSVDVLLTDLESRAAR